MAENENPDGPRLGLRVLPRHDGKHDVFVYRDADPIYRSTVDVRAAGSRQHFLRSLKAARPDLTDREVSLVHGQLEQLALQQPLEKGKHDATQPSAMPRVELVRRRDEQADALLAAMPRDIIEDAAAMLASANLLDLILADMEALGVVGERELAITLYLLATSRLLAKPLAAIIQGLSSSGKSYVAEQVVRLMPEEAVVAATDLTSQSLFYVSEDALVHRLVAAGERRRGDQDELADATRALREMIASGVLRKLVPVKREGVMESELLVRYGPIAFMESTTLTRLFDEDANRCLLLGTDEGQEQTRRVLKEQARRAAGRRSPDVARIILKHHALQRMLRRVEVVIPYAEQIEVRVPDDRPDARRAFASALSVIRAVALLHQRQRGEPDLSHGDSIRTLPCDYRHAWVLLIGPLGRALGGDMSPAVERFGVRVYGEWGGQEVTAAKVAAHDPQVKSGSKAREYLNALFEAGIADKVEEGRGSKPSVFRLVKLPEPGGATWLPHPDDIDPPEGPAPSPAMVSPPRPGGATGRQVAHEEESAGPGSTSSTAAAPGEQGWLGAMGAASCSPQSSSHRRTDPPETARSDGKGEDRPAPRANEPRAVVAPPHHGTVDDMVHDFFPGAVEAHDPTLTLLVQRQVGRPS